MPNAAEIVFALAVFGGSFTVAGIINKRCFGYWWFRPKGDRIDGLVAPE